MPRIIRLPFLTTIYTLFENSITQLLNYAQKKESKALGLKDINGKSLASKFNKYMAHVLNYNFQFNNAMLEKISTINKIRNCIAHANGNLGALSSDKQDAIKKIVERKIGVSTESKQLDISYAFLENSMSDISGAIENLMHFIEIRYGFK